MGFELREALRRLCVEIGWSYSVFWRAIGSPTPKHLAWEDGHWYGKLQLSGNDDVNSHFNSLVEIGSQGECSIDELVNKTMVPKVYDIGDGIVGLAASTGNHQWILKDVASDNASILFHLADIGNQFLAGIQTIVVIPVLPHGVVQFGSTKRVKENIIFVKHVTTSFMQLAPVPEPSFGVTQKDLGQNHQPYGSICPAISDYPFQDDCTNVDRSLSLRCNHQLFISSDSSFLSQTSSSLSSRCQENMSKFDAELCQSMIHSVGNSLFHINNSVESGLLVAQVISSGDMVSSLNRVSQEFDTYSLLPKSETMESANALEMLTSTPNCAKENIQIHSRNVSSANPPRIVQDIDSLNGSKGISKSSHVNNSSSNKFQEFLSSGNLKMESDLPQSYDVSSSSCNGLTFCPCQKCRVGSSSTISLSQGIESADFYGNHRCKVEKLQSRALEIDSSLLYVPNENSSSFLPLATTTGDDLFDILGLYGGLHRSAASGQQLAADVSVSNAQLNPPPILYSENSDLSYSEVFSKSNTDQLLDAIVSKINTGARQSLDDNISCKTSLTKVSGSSIYCGSPSSDVSASTVKRQGDYISPSMLLSNVEAASSTTVRSADSMDETRRPGSYKSEIWVENGQHMKNENLFASHGKRVDDLNMVHRKRQRPGENPRPRPKDRQLIMDRVKELREIVPNGSKCSIDALLEKTIKHMLFLQSVTKHADKLGETGEPKIISEDGCVLVKDNFQGGATWAFEVGSQPITCPIIVEDLNPPREMLVEMLCEEHGFFLEIADLIRGLGLTILKGVMEARKDKIWARFAVEANRDVTRMEIFLSLVRLLEPTFGSGATPHFIHNNNMPHKIFNLSVPAIGISDHLQ